MGLLILLVDILLGVMDLNISDKTYKASKITRYIDFQNRFFGGHVGTKTWVG